MWRMDEPETYEAFQCRGQGIHCVLAWRVELVQPALYVDVPNIDSERLGCPPGRFGDVSVCE